MISNFARDVSLGPRPGCRDAAVLDTVRAACISRKPPNSVTSTFLQPFLCDDCFVILIFVTGTSNLLRQPADKFAHNHPEKTCVRHDRFQMKGMGSCPIKQKMPVLCTHMMSLQSLVFRHLAVSYVRSKGEMANSIRHFTARTSSAESRREAFHARVLSAPVDPNHNGANLPSLAPTPSVARKCHKVRVTRQTSQVSRKLFTSKTYHTIVCEDETVLVAKVDGAFAMTGTAGTAAHTQMLGKLQNLSCRNYTANRTLYTLIG